MAYVPNPCKIRHTDEPSAFLNPRRSFCKERRTKVRLSRRYRCGLKQYDEFDPFLAALLSQGESSVLLLRPQRESWSPCSSGCYKHYVSAILERCLQRGKNAFLSDCSHQKGPRLRRQTFYETTAYLFETAPAAHDVLCTVPASSKCRGKGSCS